VRVRVCACVYVYVWGFVYMCVCLYACMSECAYACILFIQDQPRDTKVSTQRYGVATISRLLEIIGLIYRI